MLNVLGPDKVAATCLLSASFLPQDGQWDMHGAALSLGSPGPRVLSLNPKLRGSLRAAGSSCSPWASWAQRGAGPGWGACPAAARSARLCAAECGHRGSTALTTTQQQGTVTRPLGRLWTRIPGHHQAARPGHSGLQPQLPLLTRARGSLPRGERPAMSGPPAHNGAPWEGASRTWADGPRGDYAQGPLGAQASPQWSTGLPQGHRPPPTPQHPGASPPHLPTPRGLPRRPQVSKITHDEGCCLTRTAEFRLLHF